MKQIARNKVITNNVNIAFGDFSRGSLAVSSINFPSGSFFDRANSAETPKNNIPTQAYSIITFVNDKDLIISSLMAAEVPNKAKATIKGPIVVQRLLIAPPKLIRFPPVRSSPIKIINGFADVCCSEKPKATMNNPSNIPVNKLAYTETIIVAEPNAENNNSYTMLFL